MEIVIRVQEPIILHPFARAHTGGWWSGKNLWKVSRKFGSLFCDFCFSDEFLSFSDVQACKIVKNDPFLKYSFCKDQNFSLRWPKRLDGRLRISINATIYHASIAKYVLELDRGKPEV